MIIWLAKSCFSMLLAWLSALFFIWVMTTVFDYPPATQWINMIIYLVFLTVISWEIHHAE